jgi:hypothetical protein
VLVHDLGSTDGVLLAEAKIAGDRAVAWRAGTFVRLGRTTLALEEPVASALAGLEEAPDDEMVEGEVVERPTRSSARGASPSEADRKASRATNGTGAAAVASVSAAPPARPRNVRKPAWSSTDLAVVLAALAVMGLSIAGLFWLLRS